MGERQSGRVWRRSLSGEAKAGQSGATGTMSLALSWVYAAKAQPAERCGNKPKSERSPGGERESGRVWPSFAKLCRSCATGKRAENGPKVCRGIRILAGC